MPVGDLDTGCTPWRARRIKISALAGTYQESVAAAAAIVDGRPFVHRLVRSDRPGTRGGHHRRMLTGSAQRAQRVVAAAPASVLTPRGLFARGCTRSRLQANLDACRWQRFGQAIVVHAGPLTPAEQRQVALLNCGPRALLTSFTSLEVDGLAGWERPETHVLAPAGVARPNLPQLPIILHRTAHPIDAHAARRCHRPAGAALVAAGSFRNPRAACGLLAATVQQRLVRPTDLDRALAAAPRVRHRAALVAAVADIAMGAHALSEIDLVMLCRRNGLPLPEQQVVRHEPSGRRRYLDAEWLRADGSRLVVEVDGALHLVARRWWDDQLRQNELALAGSLVLRFPSAIVRLEPRLVVDQLRRALALRSH